MAYIAMWKNISKVLDVDAEADDFQNLIISSSSTHSVILRELLTANQPNRQTNIEAPRKT